MKDNAKIGRRSRQKGAQGERDVANMLKPIYPDAARGGLLQSQYGKDSNACDVEHTPWFIEVKRGARPNIQGAMDQANDASDGRPPLVITRKDRGRRPAAAGDHTQGSRTVVSDDRTGTLHPHHQDY